MTALEQKILDVIQDAFPLDERPYRVLAEMLKSQGVADFVSEQSVFETVEKMRNSGVIRRIGGVYDSKKLGFVSRLCAGKVPAVSTGASDDSGVYGVLQLICRSAHGTEIPHRSNALVKHLKPGVPGCVQHPLPVRKELDGRGTRPECAGSPGDISPVYVNVQVDQAGKKVCPAGINDLAPFSALSRNPLNSAAGQNDRFPAYGFTFFSKQTAIRDGCLSRYISACF